MGSRTERSIDAIDRRILDELQVDGRLSHNELGRRVSLSPPAVAERVRRLEELGVIVGYQARVDPARAGLPLTAFVQMRCRLERLGQDGEMPTSMVLSTQYEGRPVQPQPDEFLHASRSQGWSQDRRP